jgi:hypothetical protein
MKTTKRIHPTTAAAIAVTLTIITGCSNVTDGIFYSLEQERKIVNGTLLPDQITVQSISSIGFGTPDTADDFYVLSAGNIWAAAAEEVVLDNEGKERGLKWIAFTAPELAGFSGQKSAAGSAVAFDHLYAAYHTFTGAVYRLFRIPVSAVEDSAAADQNTSYTPEPGWDRVASGEIPDDARITGLFAVPGPGGTERLLAAAFRYESGAQAGTPLLYVTEDGTAFTQVSLDTAGEPVIDAAFDGSAWWLLTERKLYSTTDFADFTAVTDGAIAGKRFGGLEYVPDADMLFLSTQDGSIFAKPAAETDWTALKLEGGTATQMEVGGDAVEFADLGGYLDSVDLLFVGTAGNGYYEIAGVGASLTPVIRPSPNFTGTDYAYSPLSRASVLSIFADRTRNVVLMGTSANGLWKNKADEGTSNRSWFLE